MTWGWTGTSVASRSFWHFCHPSFEVVLNATNSSTQQPDVMFVCSRDLCPKHTYGKIVNTKYIKIHSRQLENTIFGKCVSTLFKIAICLPWVPETFLARFRFLSSLYSDPRVFLAAAAREKNLWYPGYYMSRLKWNHSFVTWARSIQPKFRPVWPGKVVHLKRWTSFFKTFPFGPNRSIEFMTEISGNTDWLNGSPPLYCWCGIVKGTNKN